MPTEARADARPPPLCRDTQRKKEHSSPDKQHISVTMHWVSLQVGQRGTIYNKQNYCPTVLESRESQVMD